VVPDRKGPMPGQRKGPSALPQMLTPAEVERLLRLRSVRSVYWLVDRGLLRARHVGRLLRFTPDDVQRLIDGDAPSDDEGSR
jgi:hypothetical protein